MKRAQLAPFPFPTPPEIAGHKHKLHLEGITPFRALYLEHCYYVFCDICWKDFEIPRSYLRAG